MPISLIQTVRQVRWPLAFVGASALLLAGCQTARFSDDDDPQLDPYEEMSDLDIDLAVATMQEALETAADGAAVEWSNPDTGNAGRFTPVRTYQTEGGYFCRDFEELLTVAGRAFTYDNHACRADDGVWRFTDS